MTVIQNRIGLMAVIYMSRYDGKRLFQSLSDLARWYDVSNRFVIECAENFQSTGLM